MLPYLLLLVISAAFAENCFYKFADRPYSRQAILTIKGLPTNLVYNPINKELLFTLIDVDSLENNEEQTKMDQYILRNGEPIKIDNVNGQAAAVDIKNHKVYVASDTGLHVLNRTDKANFISLKDEDIVQLYKPKHTDDLYAVIFPENDVYIVNTQTNEKKKVEDIPCAFILAVDGNDNIYYECDSKYVKVLLKDFHEPIEFAGIPKNSARAIALHSHDSVVLAANDGLYHLRPNNIIPMKLMNLEFVPSGIAFDDADNIYLSTNGIIYKYNECESDIDHDKRIHE